MLKKFAAEALGLSDIGKIVSPVDYDKTQSDDYVRHEDDEKIFFLIATKKDEYCFTNHALIHVDGESAVSSKRTLRRYPYRQYRVTNVALETAGSIDLDVEIKFTIGGTSFSIDVDKKQIDALKDLYKVLTEIEEMGYDLHTKHQLGTNALQSAFEALNHARPAQGGFASELMNLTNAALDFSTDLDKETRPKDYSDVFEKYINN